MTKLSIQFPLSKRTEKGQSAAVFAVVVMALVLFVLGVMDYMITNVRNMEAVAVADLSAHAGAQEVEVLPNGVIQVTPLGPTIAARYFSMQSRSYLQFINATCGTVQGRPACEVTVQVQSAGILLPQYWITIRALGYLANGVTRGDQ
ncbi:MAG TPA: pilus assembly protein TadG-related protein [Anaerolineales bacterium]